MTTFRFNLQRVLQWRLTQLELEEVKFRQQAATVAELERARGEWQAAGMRAEAEVRGWKPVVGRDLSALGGFRLHVEMQEREISGRLAARRMEMEAQERAMLEARRRCRLLEKLKERRQAEWQAASDHELEELASESFLAGWTRGER
jgi:hypothetical protein